MKLTELQRLFMIEQFKESGTHARHLETLRHAHMAFLFSVLLGSVPVAASIFGGTPLEQLPAAQKVAITAWILVLDVLAVFVLSAIKKLGYAHSIHSRFIMWTREKLVEDRTLLHDMFGPLGDKHRLAKSRFLSVQFSNEGVVGVAIVCLDLILLAWITQCAFRSWLSLGQLTAVIVPTVPLFVLQTIVYVRSRTGYLHGVMSPRAQLKEPNA